MGNDMRGGTSATGRGARGGTSATGRGASGGASATGSGARGGASATGSGARGGASATGSGARGGASATGRGVSGDVSATNHAVRDYAYAEGLDLHSDDVPLSRGEGSSAFVGDSDLHSVVDNVNLSNGDSTSSYRQEMMMQVVECGSSTATEGGAPSSMVGDAPPPIHDNDLLSVVGGVLPPVGDGFSCPLGGGASPSLMGRGPPFSGYGLTVLQSGGNPPLDRESSDNTDSKNVETFKSSNQMLSTVRRSQRQAALKGKVDLDPSLVKEKEKPTQSTKGKKSLFPMFISFKRNITQAISPESKSGTEPSSKKTH